MKRLLPIALVMLVGIGLANGQTVPAIRAVAFEGNQALSTDELARQFKQCVSRSNSGVFYDQALFEYCIRSVDSFMRSKGYLQAQLTERAKELREDGLVIKMSVREGPLFRLGDINIEGATVLSADEVRSLLQMKSGDVVNGDEVGKWLFEDLKMLYGKRGYIQYMAEPQPYFREKQTFQEAHITGEGVVDFKVTIDEGKQFTFGSVKFVGRDLPEQQLQGLFLLRAGDVYNHEVFERSIKALNDSGLFAFIDKDKDVEFLTDEEGTIVKLVVKLTKRTPD